MKNILILLFQLASLECIAQSAAHWTETNLKEHWKSEGVDEFEGIYENTVAIRVHSKYTFGLLKTENGYSIIYLNGAKEKDTLMWSAGDTKAYLIPTATTNLFKAKWFMGDKTVTENLYITFENGLMSIVWMDDRPKQLYLKLYPTSNDNITLTSKSAKRLSGTGFGLTTGGLIVTNYHVIEGGNKIKVRGANGDYNKIHSAKVVVADKKNDLALLQLDEPNGAAADTILFNLKTSLVGIGESIFVLGYPLRTSMGNEIKLTNGIVSSRTGFQDDITSYQISAPVQPGNSGGSLFDSNGSLIGIINAKHTGAENASYAIKTSYLLSLIELLPRQPNPQKLNKMEGKPLTQQVEYLKNFVYIIETE